MDAHIPSTPHFPARRAATLPEDKSDLLQAHPHSYSFSYKQIICNNKTELDLILMKPKSCSSSLSVKLQTFPFFPHRAGYGVFSLFFISTKVLSGFPFLFIWR
jgi:hypothetical protein